jgi:hypothetical protein
VGGVSGVSHRYSSVPERLPWWTDADQAEFDVLVLDFFEAAWLHRERCPVCSAGGPWCWPLRDVFDLLVLWARRRMLRTWAAYVRARQDFADWEAAA